MPIEDDLLKRIDATAGVVAESRAAFIREACQQRLRSLQTKEFGPFVYGRAQKPTGRSRLGGELRSTAVQTTPQRKVVNEARGSLVG